MAKVEGKTIINQPTQADYELTMLSELQAAEDAKRSLIDFTTYVNPNYDVNWHHIIVADRLDAFIKGKIKRLMIEMPPRHGKSELVSRNLPAMCMGLKPNSRVLIASYAADLAVRMSLDVQRIMSTPAYLSLFPATRLARVAEDPGGKKNKMPFKQKDNYFEVVGTIGSLRASGVAGAINGMGFDKIIIDDPHKNRAEAQSETMRKKVWEWYSADLSTRLQKGAAICVCQTRWHEADLIGMLLEKAKQDPNADQWEVLTLPAIKVDDHNPLDIRQVGDALWPAYYDHDFLAARKASSQRDWNSLYQQTPFTEGGEIVHRKWWRWYDSTSLPDTFDEQLLSVDATFKEGEGTDYVVIQAWGRVGVKKYLLHQTRRRMGFIKTVDAIALVKKMYPHARTVLIEDKANGPAIIDVLKRKISGVIPVEPKGSKLARLEAASPQIEAGCVYLPDPSEAVWVEDYVDEHAKFPNGKHDDQVDGTSQALLRFAEKENRGLGILSRM